MNIGLSEIVTPDVIDISSINGLTSFHPVVLSLLYLLIVVFLAITVILMKKKLGLKRAVRYGVIISFLSVGTLHAAVSELLWGRWLLADWNSYSGIKREDKPAVLDGDFYTFVRECKKRLEGNNYSLFPPVRIDDGAMNYYDRKLEYYLLPARNAKQSGYIIVLNDNSVTFDESTGVFKGDDGTLLFATLLYKFTPDAYLLKVKR